MTKIQNNLREFRERTGLHQTEVAKRIGMESHNRISRWEQGRALPSVMNLFKLAVLYKTSPQDLYPELFKAIEERKVST